MTLLCSSAAATALLALTSENADRHLFLALVFVALGGLLAVAFVPALHDAVTRRLVTVLTAVVLIVAVVPQPPFFEDLWVYSAYGRIIVEHGDSPYVHPPSDYPEDPWVEDLGFYRGTRNFYGPAFTAMTAAVAVVGQDSRLAVRLSYQIGAALAVMATLMLLIRAGATAGSLALFSLNPVVIVDVVTQGRMDAYIGLALVSAGFLASRRRPHLAALAIAVAALIKIPSGLAFMALVPWVFRRYGVRKAFTVAMTGIGAVGLAYLAVGGEEAIRPLIDARNSTNDVNIWVLARENGIEWALGDLSVQLGPLGSLSTLASMTALVVGMLLVLSRWDDRDPSLLLALPVLAYLLTSTYPAAWYLAWVMPLLVLNHRSRAAVISLALFPVLYLRHYYFAYLAIALNSGVEYGLVPVRGRTISSLYTAAIAIEAVGIAVLLIEALRRGWFWRRPKPRSTDRDEVAGSLPGGLRAPVRTMTG